MNSLKTLGFVALVAACQTNTSVPEAPAPPGESEALADDPPPAGDTPATGDPGRPGDESAAPPPDEPDPVADLDQDPDPDPPPEIDTTPRPVDPAPDGLLPPAPGVVLIHLEDEGGAVIEGARVRLGPQSRLTDNAGDAQFLAVGAGRVPLDIDADGFAQQVRLVEVADGSQTRHMLTLRRRTAPQPISGLQGGMAVDGALTLEFEPRGLKDLRGEVYEGVARVTVTSYGAQGEDDLRAYPAPLLGEDADGEETPLETFGAFEAELFAEDGQPLNIADGATVEARMPVPLNAGLAAGDLIPMWTLDPATGMWREAPEAVAEVVAAGQGLEMVALLPHLSVWNFDYKGVTCCFRVTIDPGGRPVSDFEIEIQGPTIRRRQRAVDTELLVIGLMCAEYVVRLFENGELLDEEVITDQTEMGSGPYGCPLDAPNAVLEAAGDRVPTVFLGGGDASAWLRIVAGTCPATGVIITVTDPDGAERYRGLVEARILRLLALAPGAWTIEAFDPDDEEGEAVGTLELDVPDEEVELRTDLQVTGAFAVPPPGGCRPRPCEGDECDSCVEVTVLDAAGDAAGGVDVSFYDPINLTVPSDAEGRACVDAPRAADREITVLPEGGVRMAVNLPRSASCEGGGCARRTIVHAAESLPCPEGTARATGESRRMGLRDPAYEPLDAYRAPFDPGPGTLRIAATSGSGRVASVFAEEMMVLGGPFGFVSKRQDPTGREELGPTWFRAEAPGVAGVGMAVDTTVAPLTLGVHDAGPAGLPVEVRVSWLPSLAESLTYTAVGGEIDVRDNARGRLTVEFTLDLEATGDTPVGAITLQGTWWVRMLSRADTPVNLYSQRSNYLNGTSVRVVTGSATDGVVFGPAGAWSADPEHPLGEIQFCVPDDQWFMMIGESWPGSLKPFSPLYGLRDLNLVPWGNETTEGQLYATPRQRWWDRSFIESVYQANGLGHVDLDTVATIYGTVLRRIADSGEVEWVERFRGAWLEDADTGEKVADAKRVLDDFSLTTLRGVAQFMFVNVQPRSPDQPLRLVVLDERGRPMPGYDQLIAPIAGGVLVPHH